MEEEVIYLESDEEITSIVDRLKTTPAGVVTLVIPKRATILQSIVNLKLLKKQTTRLNKEIAIVTGDRMGRNLAAQVGLTVYQKIDQRRIPKKKKPLLKKHPEVPLGYKRTSKKPLTVFEKDKKRVPFVDLSLRKPRIERKPQTTPPPKEAPSTFTTQGVKAEPKPQVEAKETPKVPKKPKKAGPSFLKTKALETKEFFSKLNLKILGGFVALSLIILAFVAFLILPSANVEASLNTEEIDYKLGITISAQAAEVNFEKSIVPGKLFESTQEIEENFEASGKRDIGNKATGTMTIINNSGDEQPLLVNTQFKDNKTGKVFLTNSGVVVPGATVDSKGKKVAGQTTVGVTAKDPGKDYNVKEGQFTIIKLSPSNQKLVYGVTEEAISGGSTNIVSVVSEDDLKKAKSETLKKILALAKEEFSNQLEEGYEINDGLIEKQTLSARPSVARDQQASKFSYFLKVKFITIAYKQEQVKQLAKEKVENLTSKNKKILEDTLQITYHKSKLDTKKEQIKSTAKIKGKATEKINEANLKLELKGRNKEEAESYLKSLAEINDAEVSFWPFWVKSVPSNIGRIKLDFSY
ncbi:hypothetical protein E3J85_00405 [Patescibacteria group bacterium]|nr:MAG: hypothetical protein E3J85_00405 [Patescibacteria group bacterium]